MRWWSERSSKQKSRNDVRYSSKSEKKHVYSVIRKQQSGNRSNLMRSRREENASVPDGCLK